MRTLAVNTSVTLDGVMQAPGGPEEDPTGGFGQGGWSVGYWDDVMGEHMGSVFGRPFDLLLGRKTYEIFAAHWPHVDPDSEDGAIAAPLNKATKYVASRTLEAASWQNSVLIPGDVAEFVADLKKQDGPEIQVHGSADLIQTLLARGLVDEFRLMIFPVVIGNGKRLFGSGTVPAGLELVGATPATSGVIIATYRPAGEIKGGSFAFEEPTQEEITRRTNLT